MSDNVGIGEETERPVGRCQHCGTDVPLEMVVTNSGQVFNWISHDDFAGFNTTLVLETCASPSVRMGLDMWGRPLEYSALSVMNWW